MSLERFLDELDGLLRRYGDDHPAQTLAQELAATANGLLAASTPAPRWDEEASVLRHTFCSAEEVERSFDALLEHRTFGISRANPVFSRQSESLVVGRTLTFEVAGQGEAVTFSAEVSAITADTVFLELGPSDGERQRRLLALAERLRLQPVIIPRIDRTRTRLPDLDAVPTAPDHVPSSARAPTSLRAALEDESPPPAIEVGSNAAATQFGFRDGLDAAASRMGSSNYFERLGIHFTALQSEVEEGWEKMARLTDPEEYARVDDALRDRLRAVRTAGAEAYEVLRDASTRRAHRARCANEMQLADTMNLLRTKLDTHKVRRELHDAVETLERMLELEPDAAELLHEHDALERLLRAARSGNQ